MRQWILPAVLLAVLLIASLLGLSFPYLDRVGSYLMVAAAIALAVVGAKRIKR
jgi:lipopolysaccharide export LptBFGC system permease protein LptF